MSLEPRDRVSIIIPAYRSEQYLAATVRGLLEALEARYELEIVVINDGSPDDVQRVIDELALSDDRVRPIEFGNNRGQHFATLRGMAEARGEWVVTVDDDGQNPPSAVVAVLEEAKGKNLDVVYGEFRSTAQAAARTLASRLNRWMTRVTLGNRQNLPITNVRAIRGDLARLLGNAQVAFPYIDAMIFRATRAVGSVPVEHLPRSAGVSTYRFSTLLKLWFAHLTSLTDLPLRFATAIALGTSALGFLAGVVQLVRVLIAGTAPEGWLSLFLALTFFSGMTFAVLGILSLYVGRIYVSHNARAIQWVRPPRRRPGLPSAEEPRPLRAKERAS